MTIPSNLTQRQAHIYEYVDRNPGKLKEQLVNNLTNRGLGSRKTIYKDLAQLVEDGYIKVVKQKPNSQRHYLYLNSNSVLRSLMDDLAVLKDSFIKLIDQVKRSLPSDLFEFDIHDYEQYQTWLTSDSSIPNKLNESIFEVLGIYSSLITLLEHMCTIFLLYFLVEWPKQVADSNILNKLYLSTFQSIREIRTEMSKSLPGLEVLFLPNLKVDLVNRMFILKTDILYRTVRGLKISGLKKQTEDVVDALWKFSSPFAPSIEVHLDDGIVERAGKEIHLVKDWRKVVQNKEEKRRKWFREKNHLKHQKYSPNK